MSIFIPKVPAQPDADSYGVKELQLFPRLNRAMFEAEVGEQAPPWDKEATIKRWADRRPQITTGDPDGPYTYIHYVTDGASVKVAQKTITNREAAEVNLPGAYSWPKWKPAPVNGYVQAPDGSITPINADFVTTREQAEEIADELGATEIRESTFGMFEIVYNPEETRRLWNVKLSGGNYASVGLLLRRKYRNGVGAPGKWEAKATEPRWIPAKDEAPDEYDARPEVPIPCRPLLSNEIAKAGFAGIVTIIKESAIDGGSGIDEETADLIADTNKRVIQIQHKLEQFGG